MKANEGNLNKSSGFTIVELLTVMGVIAILIGLLVPALSLVKDYSKEIQQKAQFHSIEVGLGMYKTEFGKYPPSRDNLSAYNPPPSPPAPLDTYYWAYGGANKLAEAMVGLDMLGFHPSSIFRADGQNVRDENLIPGDPPDLVPYYVYHAGVDDDPQFGESAKENVDAREGPYLELENANAFKIEDVYSDLEQSPEDFGVPTVSVDTLVLCDVYAERRAHSGKKTGMPILYYRARVQYTYQDYDVDTDPEGFDIENDIYYYPDNQNLLELGLPEDQEIDHPVSDGTDLENWEDFENMILNTQVTSVKRPYCVDSYILISAGKDGMYGTADDIFNFNKEQN